ncbi:hypothetical protein NC981_23955 [Leptolyngbya sp. DQ-M1]|uniref:hypothetical protein n=1 Tax=Leptolyngbya sp. DQ-M1 TaxID=2933920 RepID=UPI00329A7D16
MAELPPLHNRLDAEFEGEWRADGNNYRLEVKPTDLDARRAFGRRRTWTRHLWGTLCREERRSRVRSPAMLGRAGRPQALPPLPITDATCSCASVPGQIGTL